jgi:hypothetical protein
MSRAYLYKSMEEGEGKKPMKTTAKKLWASSFILYLRANIYEFWLN